MVQLNLLSVVCSDLTPSDPVMELWDLEQFIAATRGNSLIYFLSHIEVSTEKFQ